MTKREKIFYIVTALSFFAFAAQFIPLLFSPSWYIWDAYSQPNLPTLLYNLFFNIIMCVNVFCVLASAVLALRALANRPKSGVLLRVLLGIYPMLVLFYFLGAATTVMYFCIIPFYNLAGTILELFRLIF